MFVLCTRRWLVGVGIAVKRVNLQIRIDLFIKRQTTWSSQMVKAIFAALAHSCCLGQWRQPEMLPWQSTSVGDAKVSQIVWVWGLLLYEPWVTDTQDCLITGLSNRPWWREPSQHFGDRVRRNLNPSQVNAENTSFAVRRRFHIPSNGIQEYVLVCQKSPVLPYGEGSIFRSWHLKSK